MPDARRWSPTTPEPLPSLPELLREMSALLGMAYTTEHLARDLELLGYPMRGETVRLWLTSSGVPERASCALARLRLYVRACGYAPHAHAEDCARAFGESVYLYLTRISQKGDRKRGTG